MEEAIAIPKRTKESAYNLLGSHTGTPWKVVERVEDGQILILLKQPQRRRGKDSLSYVAEQDDVSEVKLRRGQQRLIMTQVRKTRSLKRGNLQTPRTTTITSPALVFNQLQWYCAS